MEANRIHVTIKKSSDTFQVSSSDLRASNADVLQALMAIVSIGTSQNLFWEFESFIIYKSGVFLMHPEQLQLRELQSGSDEKYIGHGFAKGVDIVGAEGGEPTIALTIDAKKTAFHYDYQVLAQKMTQMGMEHHTASLTRHLKGVTALVYYKGVYKAGQRERSVQIAGFGSPVKDTVIEVDGKKMKLADFVKQKYNTELKDLYLPCVFTKHHGTFSPETLMIAPNHRVRVEQMQKNVQKVIIKASASKPSDRKIEIGKLRRTINPPKELGMTVEAQPMRAAARILNSPAICTGRGEVRAKIHEESYVYFLQNGSWNVPKFVRGAGCENWTLAMIRTQGDRVDLERAADAIMKKSAELGMLLRYPKLVEVPANRREDEQTSEIVKKATQAGSTFVMLIAWSRINNHDALKKTELDYGIVTQQLKSETAGVLHSRPATLANVLKKTNEKLGGVNYTVASKDLPSWLLARSTLVVGMTIDHPRPQTKDEIENKAQPDRPAVISWGMNAVRGGEGQTEATHFSGGYFYAHPRECKLVPIQLETKKAAILRIVESFTKCRGVAPANVLLIRRINEGDQEVVLSEVGEWKAVLASMGVTPKIVVVTANLNHASRVFSTRLDEKARAMEQNLEAGLTLDTNITSPTQNEFLQKAHVPRQGTARPTKYNVLYCDEGLKISMDDIEVAMFALCHTHGVCDMTTALPTPLKISEKCTKRALNLFHHA
ncbi:hypothetical protein PMAYCL1PPCAC_33305 [Pristionchus mayeri]|uniref:Piwi domain-containing protein n=1 Tax=Pristionchus mayeri TaxID=1317129 RepID=A0AAN5DHL3_9BILA|nr:hypothetical protein PMAYCL1PPCAC_33305 [Pristionchus mayeri]